MIDGHFPSLYVAGWAFDMEGKVLLADFALKMWNDGVALQGVIEKYYLVGLQYCWMLWLLLYVDALCEILQELKGRSYRP